jgi:hypothetical protein
VNDAIEDVNQVYNVDLKVDVSEFKVKPILAKIKDQGDAGVNIINWLYKYITYADYTQV